MNFMFIVGLAGMLLAGCMTVPLADTAVDARAKQFQPDSKAAKIYIYRNEALGAALRVQVTVDGRAIGSTAKDTYLMVTVPAGTRRITSHTGSVSSLEIEVEAGKNYFVWQEMRFGFGYSSSRLVSVSEETGKAAIQKCRLVL